MCLVNLRSRSIVMTTLRGAVTSRWGRPRSTVTSTPLAWMVVPGLAWCFSPTRCSFQVVIPKMRPRLSLCGTCGTLRNVANVCPLWISRARARARMRCVAFNVPQRSAGRRICFPLSDLRCGTLVVFNVPQTFRKRSNVPQIPFDFDDLDPVQLPVPVLRPVEDRGAAVSQCKTFRDVAPRDDPHPGCLGA